MKEIQMKRGAGGLHDAAVFRTRGHIKVEKYDSDGRVIEVIEQPNMTVVTARDILLKALAGDPTRILYREPRVSNPRDINTLYYVLTYNKPRPLYKNWFSTSSYYKAYYEYYNTLVSGNSGAELAKDWEIYALDTVAFMGFGDGEFTLVGDASPYLAYTGSGWQQQSVAGAVGGTLHTTSVAGDGVELRFKGTTVAFYYSAKQDGAIVNVILDGVNVGTVNQFASETVNGIRHEVANDLDPTVEHVLVLEHSGTQDPNAASPAYISVEAFEFDSYFESATALNAEVPTEQAVFATPELYNTTLSAPYTITLLHPPLVTGTEKVYHQGVEFVKAPDTLAPAPGQYQYVNDAAGKVVGFQFAEQLTGVSVTYRSEQAYATQYGRALIERPTTAPDYPYYNYKDGTLTLVAELPPGVPNYNITVRELGLFNGPRVADGIEGWGDIAAKMFAVSRVSPITKTTRDGLRVKWTVALSLS